MPAGSLKLLHGGNFKIEKQIISNHFIVKLPIISVKNCIHNQIPFQSSLNLTNWIINTIKLALNGGSIRYGNNPSIRDWKLGIDSDKDISKFIINANGYCKECCWNLFILSNQFKQFVNINKIIDDWMFHAIHMREGEQYQVKFILCILNNILKCPGFMKLLFVKHNASICISFIKGIVLLIYAFGMDTNLEEHSKKFGDSIWTKDNNLRIEHIENGVVLWKLMETLNLYIYDIITFLNKDVSFLNVTPVVMSHNSYVRHNRNQIGMQDILIEASHEKAKKNIFASLILEEISEGYGNKILNPKVKDFVWICLNNGLKKSKKYSRKYSRNSQECIVSKCQIKRKSKFRNKKNNLFKCGGCKTVKYCSKKCQKIHWKFKHRNECKNIIY
eukprot:196177_1